MPWFEIVYFFPGRGNSRQARGGPKPRMRGEFGGRSLPFPAQARLRAVCPGPRPSRVNATDTKKYAATSWLVVRCSDDGYRFGKFVVSQVARFVAVGPPFRESIRACPFLFAQKPIVAVLPRNTRCFGCLLNSHGRQCLRKGRAIVRRGDCAVLTRRGSIARKDALIFFCHL
jgi:hypothetical protein